MQRVFKDVTPGAKLHDLPEVHNGHPMADAFYDGHIMGNKEEGNAEFFLEGQKEVDDLARTDTSRAETDSSAMMISGFIANARAIQTRWRCPPENSCG